MDDGVCTSKASLERCLITQSRGAEANTGLPRWRPTDRNQLVAAVEQRRKNI